MPFESFTFLIAKSTSINCCADKTLDEPLITAADDRCLTPSSRIAAPDIAPVAVVVDAVVAVVDAVVAAPVDPAVDDDNVAGTGAASSGVFEAADVEQEIVSNQCLNDEQSLTTLQ